MKKSSIRCSLVFIFLIVAFVLAVIININSGSVSLTLKEITGILLRRSDSGQTGYNIIWKIRLPRLCMAAILGGALSLSGLLLQIFFRNPIAGPFVLGISSGARMVVAFVTVFFAALKSSASIPVTVTAAFAGSMLTAFIVMIFAGKTRSMSKLLVIGVMIGYISTAVTDFIVEFASEWDIVNLTHWTMGSFSGSTWQQVRIALAIVMVSFSGTILLIKQINAYRLGENYARSLGVNVSVFRVLLIFLASMFSAAVIAFAGPVSFVGIAVPHITRLLFKTSKPEVLIPGTFIGGAVFCMYCDLIARTILSPAELSLGTVTSVIGAPVVIWLMLKKKALEA